MMNTVNIYYGSDYDFDTATESVDDFTKIGDLLNHISKREFSISGIERIEESPFEIDNLVIHTDDYGSLREWALLGFSKNVLQNEKVIVRNVWLNNPPKKIYEDIKKTYPNNVIEHKSEYQHINIDMMKNIYSGYDSSVIGQPQVIPPILSALYSLNNPRRKKPATILFLGESGVGKTETAKYLSSFLDKEMVRIQFSMQQTNQAYQYIFGAEHGENSLARELIRRESNIILLDEFDKVHSSFYNAFYQMFDEGMFVDENYSVNVEKCIILCTTNYLTEQEAENKLGSPIFSRFSKVIKFNSLNIENKKIVATNRYNELFEQLSDDDKAYIANNNILSFFLENITNGYYKNMRMLRNDIEDAISYEILKARGVLV